MFIRSSTAINDCLILLETIKKIEKDQIKTIGAVPYSSGMELVLSKNELALAKFSPAIFMRDKDNIKIHEFLYESQEERDKAYNELCEYLTSNYKLRDFT